jgi:hypothetical protein
LVSDDFFMSMLFELVLCMAGKGSLVPAIGPKPQVLEHQSPQCATHCSLSMRQCAACVGLWCQKSFFSELVCTDGKMQVPA